MTPIKTNTGFTLIEIMVAVSIFTIIMVISMGSILSVLEANKKSQSLRTVMDNLNFTTEAMTRTIRFGSHYHCNADVTSPPLNSPRDCASGASSIDVRSSDGHQVIYKLVGGRIVRSVDGATDYNVTSTDLTVTNLTFRVFGSPLYPDQFQPQVIIVVGGYAGAKATSKSSFNIETTVSQRLFDSQ